MSNRTRLRKLEAAHQPEPVCPPRDRNPGVVTAERIQRVLNAIRLAKTEGKKPLAIAMTMTPEYRHFERLDVDGPANP